MTDLRAIDRRIAELRGLDPTWHLPDGTPRINEGGVIRRYSPTTRWEDAGPLLVEMDGQVSPAAGGGWLACRRDADGFFAADDARHADAPMPAIARAWLAAHES